MVARVALIQLRALLSSLQAYLFFRKNDVELGQEILPEQCVAGVVPDKPDANSYSGNSHRTDGDWNVRYNPPGQISVHGFEHHGGARFDARIMSKLFTYCDQ